MIKHQKDFTAIEALAICEMLATLANDDYTVEVWHMVSRVDENGERYYPFCVTVKDKSNNDIAATGNAYLLIDALSNAYQATPERNQTEKRDDKTI